MAQRTITSPGVEIRETDLSLIAPQNIGTNFYITGFAQQGPLDEVLKITTKQELDRVFGTPTNSAERYFYYSISELLNSPGNVYASRLPYGADSGDGFGSKYSALVYPVRSVTNANDGNTLSAYSLTLNYSNNATANALTNSSFTFRTGTGILSSVGFNVASGGTGGYSPVPEIVVSVAAAATPTAVATAIKTAINGANFTGDGVDVVTSGAGTVTIPLTGYTPSTGSFASSPGTISPYDEDVRDSFTFAPKTEQVVSTNLDVTSGSYVLGEPTHLELTESQYLSAVEGSGYDWSATAGAKDSFTDVSTISGAGLVILNKAQTTINSQFEGYYLGIADNTNINPDSNFDSIVNVKTVDAALSSTLTYTTVPKGVLQFSLSATPRGTANTVSEIMENLTDYNIDGREDDDVLNIGVFKLRKSIYANEAFKLDYVLEEGMVGSANYYRQQLNPTGGPNNPFFLETKDSSSRNVKLLVNPYISNYFNGSDAMVDGKPTKKLRVNTTQLEAVDANISGIDAGNFTLINAQLGKAENLYAAGAFVNSKITDKNLGDIPSKIDRALEGVENDEIYDIDVVVEGGIGTVYAASSAAGTTYYDEYNTSTALLGAVNGLRTSNDVPAGASRDLRNNYSTIFNKFEKFCTPPFLGGKRGDCIFVADVLRQILVTGQDSRVLDNKLRNFQTDVYWPIRHQFENENTSYAAVYAQWPLVYDSFTGRQIFIPFSGFAGAAMARTDAATFPWFAPAGFTRGLIQFANDLAVNPNQKQRDELYKANINPVANFPNQGQVIFGQKTLSKKPSAFDRINVRRLFLALERPTKKASRFFVFEQNTEFTRQRLINTLTPLFERAKNNEGIYDYLIVCDERNNTAEVIDANELVVDIYIKPVRTAEFILVNFYATRTDANFEEIIG